MTKEYEARILEAWYLNTLKWYKKDINRKSKYLDPYGRTEGSDGFKDL